jgi:hypothetical protein
MRAFARHPDAAPERVWTNPASVVPNLKPRHSVPARDHPGRRIGYMVGLLQIIGGIQIYISRSRIHLLAIGRRNAGRGRAIIFVCSSRIFLWAPVIK